MTTTTDRAEYIAGLRQLADILEQHEEVPTPFQGSSYSPLSINFLSDPSAKDALVSAARAMPGPLTKDVRESGEYGGYFDLRGQIRGLHFKLTAYRNAVCERIVTGTREVTREVPDPVPTSVVTEFVEDVEWICAPLLAPDEVSA